MKHQNAPSQQDEALIAAGLQSLGPPQNQGAADEAPDQGYEAEIPSAPSPTLANLPTARRPQPATVCQTCPNSVWFSTPREVKCYCRVMYLITWSTVDPSQITACDGVYIGQME